MPVWETIIKALDPITGELKTYGGPNIEAPSRKLAHVHCQASGLGYCAIGDQIISETPTLAESITPDWNNRVDYDQENN